MDDRSVPVRPGATVLILDERPDLQVLMLERSARLVFAGSAWAFPGGRVDPDDATAAADALVGGLSDVEASAALNLDRGGIAYWVAALRETFEEAGVMLTRHGAMPAGPVDELRRAVNAGERDFVDVVAELGLVLDGAGVHYVGRWITPEGPPRRFDARFFVTAMPSGQVALHDHSEAVDHRWVTPSEALDAHGRGEMLLLTPTLAMLMRLAEFGSVGEALASAASASALDEEHVRIHPGIEGPERIAFPGDSGYAIASDRIEDGVVRWPS